VADALLQSAAFKTVLEDLIGPVRARLQSDAEAMQRKAQATRVEFFTLAREAAE
jgi:alpha-D-ribose 1-methylphosphonate 5-triphosphate synthase subunit PhnG